MTGEKSGAEQQQRWLPELVEKLVRGDRICLDPAALRAYRQGGVDAAQWRRWAADAVTVRAATVVGRFVVVDLAGHDYRSGIADKGTPVLRLRPVGEQHGPAGGPSPRPRRRAAGQP